MFDDIVYCVYLFAFFNILKLSFVVHSDGLVLVRDEMSRRLSHRHAKRHHEDIIVTSACYKI